MLPWITKDTDKAAQNPPPLSTEFSSELGGGEDAWIEVIQKMDEVYADLVQSQTQLEQQNARLEEAQLFISSVLASMTDVLIVCDIGGKIQQVNPALERLSGRSESQLRNLALEEIFDAQSRQKIGAFQERILKSGGISDCEVWLAAADGQSAPLSMNCTIRQDHKGRLAGYVLVGRPVGELRRAYEDLDAAHQQLTRTQQHLVISEKMAALGRLVAGVAHELNNPISFIYGNMHALKRYSTALTRYFSSPALAREDEELSKMREQLKIDRIVDDMDPLIAGSLEGAERVSDIVKDLLRFSSTREEELELNDVVKIVRTAVDWVIKGERVKPKLEFDAPPVLETYCRRGVLHQIIVNLVQNAADVLAGCDNALIEISCRREGEEIVILVADNGSGIAEGDFDKIFEPFFTTKPIGKGTGLGLYISYTMAQKQGGELKALRGTDGGAEFVLRIPHSDQPKKS